MNPLARTVSGISVGTESPARVCSRSHSAAAPRDATEGGTSNTRSDGV
jgi:hypothetical protein